MSAPKIPLHDFSLLLICSCCSSVDLQAFPFHRFQPTHPWKPESGSLQNALVVPCSLPKDRGVCVKTVFSAFETFDSAPVERMRGPCHLFVKRCLQLVRMCPEEAGFSQYLCFSPQSHQTVFTEKPPRHRAAFVRCYPPLQSPWAPFPFTR